MPRVRACLTACLATAILGFSANARGGGDEGGTKPVPPVNAPAKSPAEPATQAPADAAAVAKMTAPEGPKRVAPVGVRPWYCSGCSIMWVCHIGFPVRTS